MTHPGIKTVTGKRPYSPWIRRALAGACLAALAAHCPRASDPDGEPGLAQPLRLGHWQSGQLHCRQADCADWFRIQLDTPGVLRIEVRTSTGVGLSLALGDDRAIALREVSNRGTPQVGLRWKATRAGPYFVSIASRDTGKEPLPYELRARLRRGPAVSRPAPEEPTAFETVSARVMEVEGRLGQAETVLFVSDHANDLRRGLRGHLVEDGQTIGEVEVIDVYSDGGVRARIDGVLTGTVTSSTRVEIAVPVTEGDWPLKR